MSKKKKTNSEKDNSSKSQSINKCEYYNINEIDDIDIPISNSEVQIKTYTNTRLN